MPYKYNPISGNLDLVEPGSTGPPGSTGAWGSATAKTISGGIVATDGEGYYSIDTEGAAASDALDKLTGLADGDEVILKAANDARTVVVTNGTYIKTEQGVDCSLNNVYDGIRLQCIGSDTCVERGRSSPGD